MIKIGKSIFKNPIFLSPMAGVGDFAFRAICRKFGADLSYTEMISVKALLHKNKKTENMLFCLPEEKPSAVQLFGNDESDYEKVLKLEALSNFDFFDLNFGCPAPKIFNNGEGSALLKNPYKIYKIISSCVRATKKPITAKIRIGIDEKSINGCEVARACEDAGASLLTVHGRVRQQMYSGKVNYEEIAKIKTSTKIPVIGNGDIVDEVSYKKMLETKVDGVSLARGALGKPWIFSILKSEKKQIKVNEQSNLLINCLNEHVRLLRTKYDDKFLNLHLRKHFLWYLKGYNAPTLKLEICHMDDLDFMVEKLEAFLKNNKIQKK